MTKATLILSTLLACAVPASAGYLAVGPFEGTVCEGLVFKSCSPKTLAAVEGPNGSLHEITRYFESVDSVNSSGRCTIRIRKSGVGVIGNAMHAVMGPKFYEMDSSGRYSPVDVEYLTFSCVRQ